MKQMKKFLSIICMMLVFSMSIVADIPVVGEQTVVEAAEKVKLNKTSVTILVNKAIQLELFEINEKIKWSSSDKTIATVNASGKVKGKKYGETTIVAKVKGKSYKCKIRVENPKIGKCSSKMKVGDKAKIEIENCFSKVKWTSSNRKILSVDNKGNVKALSDGVAVVYAKVNGKTLKKKITIIPLAKTITLNSSFVQLKKGETYLLNANIYPDNALQMIKWSSSDVSVATISGSGEVTAIGVGQTTITAECLDGSMIKESCSVKVVATPEKIELNASQLNIFVGQKETLKATIYPSDIEGYTVTWKSSNEKVASVDSNGTVTGIAAGYVTITVNVGGCELVCGVTVSEIKASEIRLSDSAITMGQNETKNISATVYPIDATDKKIIWTSSNESIASVDNNGNVTGKMEGSVTITARCGNVIAECNVTVRDNSVTSISMDQSELFLAKGKSLWVMAQTNPVKKNQSDIRYTSSNPSIATVNGTGVVEGISRGVATITATYGEYSCSCIVTVLDIEIECTNFFPKTFIRNESGGYESKFQAYNFYYEKSGSSSNDELRVELNLYGTIEKIYAGRYFSVKYKIYDEMGNIVKEGSVSASGVENNRSYALSSGVYLKSGTYKVTFYNQGEE